MPTIKCKNCGNSFEIPEGKKEGFCTNCGTLNKIEEEVKETTEKGSNYDTLLRKGFIYLKNNEFDVANKMFDLAVMEEELCGSAYLGKLYCDYEATSYDDFLTKLNASVLDDNNLNLAFDFGDKATKKIVDNIKTAINADTLAKRYNFGVSKLAEGGQENIDIAQSIFTKLDDYKDSKEKLKECSVILIVGDESLINNMSIQKLDEARKMVEDLTAIKNCQLAKDYIDKINDAIAGVKENFKAAYLTLLSTDYPSNATLENINDIINKLNIAFEKQDLISKEFPDLLGTFESNKISAQNYIFDEFKKLIKTKKDLNKIQTISKEFLLPEQDKEIESLIKVENKEIQVVKKHKRKKKIIIGVTCGILGALVIGTSVTLGITATAYNDGMSLLNKGDYEEALDKFNLASFWSDAGEKKLITQTIIDGEELYNHTFTTGYIDKLNDVIKLGNKVKIIFSGETIYSKTYDSSISESNLFTVSKRGYTFNSWSMGTISYENDMITVVLKPSYTIINYTISYALDGGTNSSLNPGFYNVTTKFVLNKPTKSGYSFLYWTDSGGIKTTGITVGTIGHIVFYAHWEKIDEVSLYNSLLQKMKSFTKSNYIDIKTILDKLSDSYLDVGQIRTQYNYLVSLISNTTYSETNSSCRSARKYVRKLENFDKTYSKWSLTSFFGSLDNEIYFIGNTYRDTSSGYYFEFDYSGSSGYSHYFSTNFPNNKSSYKSYYWYTNDDFSYVGYVNQSNSSDKFIALYFSNISTSSVTVTNAYDNSVYSLEATETY